MKTGGGALPRTNPPTQKPPSPPMTGKGTIGYVGRSTALSASFLKAWRVSVGPGASSGSWFSRGWVSNHFSKHGSPNTFDLDFDDQDPREIICSPSCSEVFQRCCVLWFSLKSSCVNIFNGVDMFVFSSPVHPLELFV